MLVGTREGNDGDRGGDIAAMGRGTGEHGSRSVLSGHPKGTPAREARPSRRRCSLWRRRLGWVEHGLGDGD